MQSARVSRESYVGTWLPEPVLTGPGPEEHAEMADEGIADASLAEPESSQQRGHGPELCRVAAEPQPCTPPRRTARVRKMSPPVSASGPGRSTRVPARRCGAGSTRSPAATTIRPTGILIRKIQRQLTAVRAPPSTRPTGRHPTAAAGGPAALGAVVVLDGLSYRRAARMVGIRKTGVGDSLDLLLGELAALGLCQPDGTFVPPFKTCANGWWRWAARPGGAGDRASGQRVDAAALAWPAGPGPGRLPGRRGACLLRPMDPPH